MKFSSRVKRYLRADRVPYSWIMRQFCCRRLLARTPSGCSFDESRNRNIARPRLGPDERDNSSLKRLIAAGLELLSLPANGSREEEKEGEKDEAWEKVERWRKRRR